MHRTGIRVGSTVLLAVAVALPWAGSAAEGPAEAKGGSPAAPRVRVINMIPKAQSGETNQDSEPNLAVNPSDPRRLAGSAFTPDPMGGPNAPIFASTDGGESWVLNTIVPSSNGSATGDITVRFSGTGDTLYAGILRRPGFLRLNILRTDNFLGAAPMTVLVDRNSVDQPYVQAARVAGGPDAGKDRVFVGNNDFAAPGGKTASIDRSLDAATAAPPAGFATFRIEARNTSGQDGPPIRPAIHADGTVYGAFYGWRKFTGAAATADVVVVRDDHWGAGPTPFKDLVDPGDNLSGKRVAASVTVPWANTSQPAFGQERFVGSNISIAVSPQDSGTAYVAWADRVGTDDYTLHVRRSTDRGATWSGDLYTVLNATNPALAISDAGTVGFLYQQVKGTGAGQRWATHFEETRDGFKTRTDLVLADVPATAPAPQFLPYIGDYVHLMAVGRRFYGIFSANNTPDRNNFPQGVKYQRNADFSAHQLLGIDGKTPVAVSIDPFFFTVEDQDAAPRYVYDGCEGTFHLAGDTGTAFYWWRSRRWLANLAYEGTDGQYWYYSEKEYPDYHWAFARRPDPWGGWPVWLYPKDPAQGGWAFYEFAHRLRP
jgi:hypothetical protein